MIFPGFPGVLCFYQVFQVDWELCNSLKFHFSHLDLSRFRPHLSKNPFWRQMEFPHAECQNGDGKFVGIEF